VCEHASEVAAVDPATTWRATDKMLGLVLRRIKLNGQTLQKCNTHDMLFNVAGII
jgi:2-keto-4-pentenoate hydratase/2-oxohepta-3-ene-1,7-dioic acid hydratase in catechol pathway